MKPDTLQSEDRSNISDYTLRRLRDLASSQLVYSIQVKVFPELCCFGPSTAHIYTTKCDRNILLLEICSKLEWKARPDCFIPASGLTHLWFSSSEKAWCYPFSARSPVRYCMVAARRNRFAKMTHYVSLVWCSGAPTPLKDDDAPFSCPSCHHWWMNRALPTSAAVYGLTWSYIRRCFSH